MKYKVSYKRHFFDHNVFVDASSAEVAKDYIKCVKFDALILNVAEAKNDEVAANPVIYVNEARWVDVDNENHICSTCKEPASEVVGICPFCLSYMKSKEKNS